MEALTTKKVLAGLDRKVKYLFGVSKDGFNEPSHVLMSSIVLMALSDLYDYRGANSITEDIDRRDALRYLRGNMPHAQACGVSPGYLRRLFKSFGLDVSKAKIVRGVVEAPIDKSGWNYGGAA